MRLGFTSVTGSTYKSIAVPAPSRSVLGPRIGQHEIEAIARAPAAEGLAEILVMLLQADVGGDVVDAEHAEEGVHREAHPVLHRVVGLALQEVVEADEDVGDVGEEVAHPPPHRLGHDVAIRGGHRPHHRRVEPFVEAVDRAVHRLERVARVAVARAGAAGEREEDGDQGGTRQHHLPGSLAGSLPSAALLKRNWLIRFSSTTADWVRRKPVAALQHHAVAAGLEAEVLLAEDARGEDLGGRIARKTGRPYRDSSRRSPRSFRCRTVYRRPGRPPRPRS